MAPLLPSSTQSGVPVRRRASSPASKSPTGEPGDRRKTTTGPRMRGVPADGRFIKKGRRSLGLTQEALAADARCDVKTVYRAENDAFLDIATLVRLAAALDVPYRKVVQRHARA